MAGIQYIGVEGCTQACLEAVVRLLQCRVSLVTARIMTSQNDHCLLLTDAIGDIVVVKSGFSSGYRGEGPRGFSRAISMLNAHSVEIEEIEVSSNILDRVDTCSLTDNDLENLTGTAPIRPQKWHDYVDDKEYEGAKTGELWQEFDPVMPYSIIDARLFDLACSFWQNHDSALMNGYRRLEDIVRSRTNIDDHSAKLFSTAFLDNPPKLQWPNASPSEQKGRANMFTAAFMAFRNPRAHKIGTSSSDADLAEFLLLNQLFVLEREAIEFESNA